MQMQLSIISMQMQVSTISMQIQLYLYVEKIKFVLKCSCYARV